ncbi:RNA_recognition motif domain [Hexamita inflata]|uniref:RNA recognition motif domain n=1 Tax=Hexamita inflata TaxID=28002 RepID=A0AA86Q668_9EUKA|nr:RNA recognition motif domain [Hexamita inflata]
MSTNTAYLKNLPMNVKSNELKELLMCIAEQCGPVIEIVVKRNNRTTQAFVTFASFKDLDAFLAQKTIKIDDNVVIIERSKANSSVVKV